MNKWMDGQMNGQWIDEQMDGQWIDEQMDGWTDNGLMNKLMNGQMDYRHMN